MVYVPPSISNYLKFLTLRNSSSKINLPLVYEKVSRQYTNPSRYDYIKRRP